jgi:hypothetical protein
MCSYCTNLRGIQYLVYVWAIEGMAYTRMEVLARPTDTQNPNTYVFVMQNAIVVNGANRDVYIDMHYRGHQITPGADLIAIGGLWIPGVKGAMYPQQHDAGDTLRKVILAELPRQAPKIVSGTWGHNTPLPSGLRLA